MELDLQVSPQEIMSREVELGCESWTSFASSCSSTAVQRTLSLWLCPSTAVETAIAQCTSRCAMARRHRLNTSIVLAAVHGLSGLRLQALVYDILPSTTALFIYAIGSRKLSANEQFFVGAQTEVRLKKNNRSTFKQKNNSNYIRRLFCNWPCCLRQLK